MSMESCLSLRQPTHFGVFECGCRSYHWELHNNCMKKKKNAPWTRLLILDCSTARRVPLARNGVVGKGKENISSRAVRNRGAWDCNLLVAEKPSLKTGPGGVVSCVVLIYGGTLPSIACGATLLQKAPKKHTLGLRVSSPPQDKRHTHTGRVKQAPRARSTAPHPVLPFAPVP